MTDDPKPVSVINAEELVRRIEEAKKMRATGASEDEIKAIEPSEDEMRVVLMDLRKDYSKINEGAKKSASKKQPKTLDGLLSEPL